MLLVSFSLSNINPTETSSTASAAKQEIEVTTGLKFDKCKDVSKYQECVSCLAALFLALVHS